MSNEVKHTPGPVYCDEQSDGAPGIWDTRTGALLATIAACQDDHCIAVYDPFDVGREIERRYNCHDDLLAALEGLADWAQIAADSPDCQVPAGLFEALDTARAALAKAKGGAS